LFTKERVKPSEDKEENQKIPFKLGLKLLLTNKYWLILVPILAAGWLLTNFIQGATIYYAEHLLGDASLVGLLTLLFLIPLLIAFLVLPYLANKLGRKNVIIYGMILVIAGSLFMLLAP